MRILHGGPATDIQQYNKNNKTDIDPPIFPVIRPASVSVRHAPRTRLGSRHWRERVIPLLVLRGALVGKGVSRHVYHYCFYQSLPCASLFIFATCNHLFWRALLSSRLTLGLDYLLALATYSVLQYGFVLFRILLSYLILWFFFLSMLSYHLYDALWCGWFPSIAVIIKPHDVLCSEEYFVSMYTLSLVSFITSCSALCRRGTW